MKQPSINEFVQILLAGVPFTLRRCSICNAALNYLCPDRNKLYFDAGCDCVKIKENSITRRAWEELGFLFIEKNGYFPKVSMFIHENKHLLTKGE